MSYCDPSAEKIFVPEKIANRRIKKFQRLKHKFLSKKIGKQEALYSSYTTDQFLEILRLMKSFDELSGFRIYFAAFVGTQHVPENAEKIMTLIFAPTKLRPLTGELYGKDDEHDDLGHYVINPLNEKVIPLEEPIKNQWLKAYIDVQLTHLEAEFPTIRGKETKSMWYSKEVIDALVKEINCWRTEERNPIVSIQIFFACYLKADKPYIDPSTGDEYVLNDKSTLIFYFINKNEDEDDKLVEEKVDFNIKFEKLTDYDTGSPCPPAKCPN